jgi:ABC-type transport system involved in multi-copper enzyme maturation permease subunit
VNATLVTIRKELLSYCCSPVSYLVAVLFYLLHGMLLHSLIVMFALGGADADILPTQSYGLMSTFVMVVLVPALLTMRCFAEERRSG